MSGDRRREVAVFGAGIAGLTVAHELIERGFRVDVYETAPPSIFEQACGVGGMAATQWSRTDPPSPGGTPAMRPTGAILELRQRITFAVGETEPDWPAKRMLEEVAAQLTARPDVGRVEVCGYTHRRPADGDPDRDDLTRAAQVVRFLTHGAHQRIDPERLAALGLGVGRPDDWTRPDEERCYVEFRVVQDVIPGEHGFRFFPSFYDNLFDTLRRTPIPEEGAAYVETPYTVFDNVTPTEQQGVSPANPEHNFVMPRERPSSLRALLKEVDALLVGTEITPVDLARFQLRLVRYLTSCRDRRAGECETQSWWDYLGGDGYGASFQRYLEKAPQALVAMTAKDSDARTQGSATVRLLLFDEARAGERTDGTLNGPTSLAWFAHWRRYLEQQGVTFHRGTLTGFEVLDDETAWPVADLVDDRGRVHPTVIVRDFYVMALPVQAAQDIVRRAPALRGEDVEKLRRFDLGDITVARPAGPLQHLSGIQYYFPTDTTFVRGHIVYPDSPWGLTSISQPQFWTRKRGWWDGYAGILSVDIGDFYTPSPRLGRCAWECTADEIADEVWRQIRETLPDPSRVADPILYHLDTNLVFDGAGRLSHNRSPMLINRVGAFQTRPGKPGAYAVNHGSVVLAGTYMQTFTRLTTMEAANESGRHAVNAILDAVGFQGDRCRVWDIEDVDLGDVQWLVDLDAKMYAAGLPHAFDVLGFESLPTEWLEGAVFAASLGLVRR